MVSKEILLSEVLKLSNFYHKDYSKTVRIFTDDNRNLTFSINSNVVFFETKTTSVQMNEEFNVLVDGVSLLKVSKAFPDKNPIKLYIKDNKLVFSDKEYCEILFNPINDVNRFVFMPNTEPKFSFKIDANLLLFVLDKIDVFSSEIDGKSQGCSVFVNDDIVTFMVTNNIGLASYKIKFNGRCDKTISFVIPYKFFKAIPKSFDCSESMNVEIFDKFISISNSKTKLSFGLLECKHKYDRVENLLNMKMDNYFIVDSEDLLSTVKKMKAIGNVLNSVTLKTNNGQLYVTAKDDEGEGIDIINILEHEGNDDLNFSVLGKYMTEILSFKIAKKCKIECSNTPKMPIRISFIDSVVNEIDINNIKHVYIIPVLNRNLE